MFLTFVSIIFCTVLFLFVISLCKISAQADRDMNKIWRREFLNSITEEIVLEEITTEDEDFISSTKIRKAVNF